MFDQNEFKNLIKTVMQVEYLLLCLVLLYITIPGTMVNDRYFLVLAGIGYTAFLMAFHLLFRQRLTPPVLAIKAIITMLFISFMVWHTGKMESPLIMLYLVGVISSSMVIGLSTTLLLCTLISVCLIFVAFSEYSIGLFSAEHITEVAGLVINIFALYLVAYLAFMLSSHMQSAKDLIKASSEMDELTGLLNLRTFTHIMENDHKRFSQYSGKFTVLIIDVDNLKTINDEYGYVIGNRLLMLIANILKRTTKATDVVGRYGDDEYIVLLAETEGEAARKAAERLRSQIDVTPLIIEGGKEVFATVSVGGAAYPDDSDDFNELIKRAYIAMYECKDQGKNQTMIYGTMFATSAGGEQVYSEDSRSV